MRVLVLVVAGMVLLSGCSGVLGPLDDGGSSPDTETEHSTGASTSRPTSTPTPTATPAHSQEEIEHLNSTDEFGNHVRNSLTRHNHTRYVSHKPGPNNTVKLTIQTDGKVPLERTIMDAVQIMGEVVIYTTTNTENPPRKDDGTFRLLHQPDNVSVDVNGPNGSQLGSYQVDPASLREYRLVNLSAQKLADAVMDSYQAHRQYERGPMQASHYLNRSELTLWVHDYRKEVQNWTANGSFDSPFPIGNIRINPSKNEALHEFTWDRDKFSQYFGSASATVLTGYWRTTDNYYAMPPKRLNIYIHLPENDKDYAGYMNRTMVWWLLGTDKGTQARESYFNQEKYWFVDKDEDPFEGFSRPRSNSSRRSSPSLGAREYAAPGPFDRRN